MGNSKVSINYVTLGSSRTNLSNCKASISEAKSSIDGVSVPDDDLGIGALCKTISGKLSACLGTANTLDSGVGGVIASAKQVEKSNSNIVENLFKKSKKALKDLLMEPGKANIAQAKALNDVTNNMTNKLKINFKNDTYSRLRRMYKSYGLSDEIIDEVINDLSKGKGKDTSERVALNGNGYKDITLFNMSLLIPGAIQYKIFKGITSAGKNTNNEKEFRTAYRRSFQLLREKGEDINDVIYKDVNLDEIYKAREKSPDAFFNYFYKNSGYYGCDQGVFRKQIKKDSTEYDRLVTVLTNKYNLSNRDAKLLMKNLDGGACTYASAADVLALEYATKPDEFFMEYGFPLYIVDESGKVQLNTGELLLTEFIETNIKERHFGGNPIFNYEKNGLELNKDMINDEEAGWEDMRYFDEQNNFRKFSENQGIMNQDYKNFNGDKVIIKEETIAGNYNVQKKDEKEIIKRTVENELKNGSYMRMAIRDSDGNPTTAYYLYDLKNENNVQVRGNGSMHSGHSVCIVGSNEDGIIVSTWGSEYLLKYDDILNNGNYIKIDKVTFEEKGILG